MKKKFTSTSKCSLLCTSICALNASLTSWPLYMTWDCNSQFGHQVSFRHKGRSKLFPEKQWNSYSFASEAGNFGDEFSVPGLSRRYDPSKKTTKKKKNN
jgi:hypothetical protein